MKRALLVLLVLAACAVQTSAQTILGRHPADTVLPQFWLQNGNAAVTAAAINQGAVRITNLDLSATPQPAGWLNNGTGGTVVNGQNPGAIGGVGFTNGAMTAAQILPANGSLSIGLSGGSITAGGNRMNPSGFSTAGGVLNPSGYFGNGDISNAMDALWADEVTGTQSNAIAMFAAHGLTNTETGVTLAGNFTATALSGNANNGNLANLNLVNPTFWGPTYQPGFVSWLGFGEAPGYDPTGVSQGVWEFQIQQSANHLSDQLQIQDNALGNWAFSFFPYGNTIGYAPGLYANSAYYCFNGRFVGNGASLTALNASAISTGLVPDAQLPGARYTNSFDALGAAQNATNNLSASQLKNGTLPLAQLPGVVVTNGAPSVLLGGITSTGAVVLIQPVTLIQSMTAGGDIVMNPGGFAAGSVTMTPSGFTGPGSGITGLSAPQVGADAAGAALAATNNLGSAAWTASSTYDAAGTGSAAALAATNAGIICKTNSTGVNLQGAFSGNGGSLTNIGGLNLTGTSNTMQLAANLPAAGYVLSATDPTGTNRAWVAQSGGISTGTAQTIAAQAALNATNNLGPAAFTAASAYDAAGTGAAAAQAATNNLGVAAGNGTGLTNNYASLAAIPTTNTLVSSNQSAQIALSLYTTIRGYTQLLPSNYTNYLVDFNLGSAFLIFATNNVWLTAPANVIPGGSVQVIIVQDSVGTRMVGFTNTWKFSYGLVPLNTTNANAVDVLMVTGLSTTTAGSTNVAAQLQPDFR